MIDKNNSEYDFKINRKGNNHNLKSNNRLTCQNNRIVKKKGNTNYIRKKS